MSRALENVEHPGTKPKYFEVFLSSIVGVEPAFSESGPELRSLFCLHGLAKWVKFIVSVGNTLFHITPDASVGRSHGSQRSRAAPLGYCRPVRGKLFSLEKRTQIE